MTDRAQHWAWCDATLPAVSRTFALCIRFLPDELRRTVTLSYLLCRVADTLEDTPGLTGRERADRLARLSAALDDATIDLCGLGANLTEPDDPDARLVAEAPLLVSLLHGLPDDQRGAVNPWVREMCAGMAEYATRSSAGIAGLRMLDTEADLLRYCHFVAGTVGRLLTALFAVQRPELGAERVAKLEALAEDFGIGLQLVNILADVARDHDRGVCYVPEALCLQEGLSAGELLAPERWPEARAVLEILIDTARTRLGAAREYCQLLPRMEYQIRLFCVTPYFLALRTLRALAEDPRYPVAGQRIKVGRRRVHRTIVAAQLCAASNRVLRAYSRRLDEAVWSSQAVRSA